MKSDELRALALPAYGRGWQSKLARDLGCARQTVSQWSMGRRAIGGPEAIAIKCCCLHQKA